MRESNRNLFDRVDMSSEINPMDLYEITAEDNWVRTVPAGSIAVELEEVKLKFFVALQKFAQQIRRQNIFVDEYGGWVYDYIEVRKRKRYYWFCKWILKYIFKTLSILFYH